MTTQTATAGTEPHQAPAPDDLGIDRAFLMQMARIPFIAAGWVLAAFLSHVVWGAIAPAPNYGPLVVVCFGMVLAAVIDGWAFKVPNWLTFPLILSGWLLGLIHDVGWLEGTGVGGLGAGLRRLRLRAGHPSSPGRGRWVSCRC